MMQIPLYKDSHNRYFYVTDDEVFCDDCGIGIDGIVFVRCSWCKSSQLGLLCKGCASGSSFDAQVEEWKIARIVYDRKVDFVPVLIVFPGLKNSDRDLSIFDVDKLNSSMTKDKTRYAGRESWNGVSIGSNASISLCEEKDKILSLNDANELLEDEKYE